MLFQRTSGFVEDAAQIVWVLRFPGLGVSSYRDAEPTQRKTTRTNRDSSGLLVAISGYYRAY